MAEVARRAGVSKGVVTYHFAAKDDLMFAAVAEIFDSVKEFLEDRLGGTSPERFVADYINASAPALAPAAAIRPAGAAFAVGMVLFLAGFGMRRWSEMTLGRYFTFTVMTSAEQPVITSGPYRFARHPGYTGVLADPARVGPGDGELDRSRRLDAARDGSAAVPDSR